MSLSHLLAARGMSILHVPIPVPCNPQPVPRSSYRMTRGTHRATRALRYHARLAVLTSVVALDYARLRFGQAPWLEPTPALDALADQVADRPAYATTVPHL